MKIGGSGDELALWEKTWVTEIWSGLSSMFANPVAEEGQGWYLCCAEETRHLKMPLVSVC